MGQGPALLQSQSRVHRSQPVTPLSPCPAWHRTGGMRNPASSTGSSGLPSAHCARLRESPGESEQSCSGRGERGCASSHASCTLGQAGHCQGQQEWAGLLPTAPVPEPTTAWLAPAAHWHVQDGVYKGISLLEWEQQLCSLPHPSLPGSSSRSCKSLPTKLSPPASARCTSHTQTKTKLHLLIISLN